jgi:hypothetical protein
MTEEDVKPVDEVEEHEEVHNEVKEVKEETVVEETPVEEVKEAEIVAEEPPQQKKKENRRGHKPKMSESKKLNVYKKEECPDCKKMLTVGNLRYKHSKFCVGKKMKDKAPPPAAKPVAAASASAPITEREVAKRVEAFNEASKPVQPEGNMYDEVFKRYITDLKKQEQERRKNYYDSLINLAIRKRNI